MKETIAELRRLVEGIKRSHDQFLRIPESVEKQVCTLLPALLDRLEELEADRERLTELLSASEEWRQAYQKGKYELYSMGGEVCAAAMKHLPASEGGIDRAVDKFVGRVDWQRNAAKALTEIAEIAAVESESMAPGMSEIVEAVRNLRADRERLDHMLNFIFHSEGMWWTEGCLSCDDRGPAEYKNPTRAERIAAIDVGRDAARLLAAQEGETKLSKGETE